MKLHEIDPAKRYIQTVEADGIARQDIGAMQEKLKQRGLENVTVAAGPITSSDEPRFWGIWVSPPDGQPGWVRNPSSDPLYYPSPVIAELRRVDLGWEHSSVKEFTLNDTLQDVVQIAGGKIYW